MKEEKLFEIVNNVDDDLICEMLEYSPDKQTKSDGSEYEGTLYTAPEKVKKAHYWQYPVTAAAVMLAVVGALFIFNQGSTLPYNGGEQTGEQETTPGTTSTAETEITTTDDPGIPVDTNIPYEFTQEDKELQKFLAETADEAMKYQGLIDSGGYFGDIGFAAEGDQEHERIINARFPQMKEPLDKQITYGYMLLSDEMPFKTSEELEANLKQYYSAEIVSQFMGYVDIGEIAGNTEEYSLIELTEGGRFDEDGFLLACPYFVELNGRLYSLGAAKGGWFTPNWSMAKVISKTDEELIFSFLGYGMDDIKQIRAGLGRLKYEDGWKYDWWDIANPYEMVDFEEVWGTGTGTVEKFSPLDLMHCRLCEDGHYRIDEDILTVYNNYDLFRQYFFGTWEGNCTFVYTQERGSINIDDSLKSFNMIGPEPWLDGTFYMIDSNVLTFMCGSMTGSTLFWIDVNDPETMYYTYGGVGEYNWLWDTDEGGVPIVSSLKKSDLPPNEPEKNFLSIFRLREISRDYGIDFSLLVDISLGYMEDDAYYSMSHNVSALFYPVYLVSESADRFEFRTTVGNGFEAEMETELSFTIEKLDGKWVRTLDTSILEQRPGTVIPEKTEDDIDICYSDYGLSSQTVSDHAVTAFLSNDSKELSKYLADPSYEALSEGSENIYSRVTYMTWNVSDLTEKDGVYSMIYNIALDNALMLIHLDVGMREIDGEWKVEYIYLQG